MDALAVSIAAGTSIDSMTGRHVFRLAFHFGLFQFLMPILGWWSGSVVSGHVVTFGHWLAFVLLSLIAGKMLLDARRETPRKLSVDPTRGWMLVALSLATSVDALGAGFSLACLQEGVWLPSIVIGLTAAAFSAVGISFANRLLRRSGRVAEVLGAGVLLLIGIRILLAHGPASA
jgi:putative Mn2+ efflux pump MntP